MTQTTVSEAVLNQLAREAHENSVDKGFWNRPEPFVAEINTKLMLIVSEVAEAQETLRKIYTDLPAHPWPRMTPMQSEDFLEELADVVIRVFDLAHYLTTGDDFGGVLLAKMARNAKRPRLHGKRF